MDAIIAILIIAFALSGIVKKSKGAGEKRPGQAPPPINPHEKAGMPMPEDLKGARGPARPAAPPRPRAAGLPPELREIFGMDEEKAPAPQTVYRPKPKPREGESRLDADGCVGGSIPHQHSVPVPTAAKAMSVMKPQEYASPVARVRSLAASDADAHASASMRAPSLTAEEMRRAVMLAEVLARPVSLRPRGHKL